jgi:hypothetical protein
MNAPDQNRNHDAGPNDLYHHHRQNYCRPATVSGNRARYLFPLEGFPGIMEPLWKYFDNCSITPGNPDCDTPVCRGKRPEDHLGIMCECHFHPKCRYKPEGDGCPVKGKRKPKELNYAISR